MKFYSVIKEFQYNSEIEQTILTKSLQDNDRNP